MPRLKILLDECLDRRLVKEIPYHLVKTVPDMGWAGLKNGELLRNAQQEFDVFITSDQNLSFQQNLPRFNIAVVILCSPSNKLEDLLVVLAKAIKQLNSLKAGQAAFVKL